MQRLFETMQRMVDGVPTGFKRYLYPQINWENKMLGLVGPRGVGKTTLFLQRIKERGSAEKPLFVSADNLYFADHTLYDTAEGILKMGGTHFFIDEVHKYPGWSRELKMMYDMLPGLHVFFTGSSVLDIEKGEADLSRRAPRYLLQGLSFREYLAMRHGIEMEPLSLDEILGQQALLPGIDHPLPLFHDYLRTGYYPFGVDPDFDMELGQVVVRTLEVDIPSFASMTVSTGRKLRKLMAYVSVLSPFKPNFAQLAGQVGVSRNNVEEYLLLMEKAGMIAQLRTKVTGLNSLGKVEKVYLDNTNILYSLSDGSENVGSVRETFFFNQMRVNHKVTASPLADFEINGITFEVGGRSKGQRQLAGAARGVVVKDDIEYGFGNTVPLWAFGLTY